MDSLVDLRVALDRVNAAIEKYELEKEFASKMLLELNKKKEDLSKQVDELKQTKMNLFAKNTEPVMGKWIKV